VAPLKWFQVKNLKEVGMIDIELENAKNQRRSMHRMIGLILGESSSGTVSQSKVTLPVTKWSPYDLVGTV